MRKKQYGNPVLTLRLPRWQIIGLKVMAEESGTTVSGILREYVAAYLAENGITENLAQLPGQVEMHLDA